MNSTEEKIKTLLLTAIILFSPTSYAAETYARTGITASYLVGYSKLQNVGGFNTPETYGYRLGFQGDRLGVSYGQSSLGQFTLSNSSDNYVGVDTNEFLISYRSTSNGASLIFYYGLADWNLVNSTPSSQHLNTGTSPVMGIGLKMGNNLGILLTAMYYEDITDSDILSVNIGINY
ncbi:MAG: hypothetical protein OEX12_13030 [Gammaproteobacteria bacterium]|nr:hypothetical protein [Gammaproteobacteria bacterium]